MSATIHTPRHPWRRSLAIAAGALALACTGAQAAPYGGGWHGGGGGWHGGGGGWHGHGGGWHGGGRVVYRGGWGYDPLWGFGLGLGIAALAAPAYYDQPDVVYVNPPVYYAPAPVYSQPAPVYAPPAPAVADPIFYPRNGQSAAQTEADRQDCNRWATTQPRAMADASIFQRATFACMDGRGYSAR
jgi:hypothetical protein